MKRVIYLLSVVVLAFAQIGLESILLPSSAAAAASQPQPPGSNFTWISSPNSSTSPSGAFLPFPQISYDGRYIAFQSDAPNLVSSDNNNKNDIFVKDIQINQTT